MPFAQRKKMRLWGYIDLYCERTEPGLWAEPVNLFSNLSFVFAGVLAWRQFRNDNDPHRMSLQLLCALAVAVGIGSAAFHAFATRLAQLADVIPIALFVAVYFLCTLRLGFRDEVRPLGVYALAFALLSVLFAILIPGQWVNGSQLYFGTLVALVFLSFRAYKVSSEAGNCLLGASLVFLMALIFRSIDLFICELWPLGTHFLWHLGNGLVIYFCIAAFSYLVATSNRKLR
jgi:hypothetical protein